MKNKLKSVHVDSIEWNYAISDGELRIYEPGTKQIKTRVKLDELPTKYAAAIQNSIGFTPANIKQYILDNLI